MNPPERASVWRRWSGIRGHLLLLLLPGLALMLVTDSWTDHEYHETTLDNLYDDALLRPLSALNRNVRIDSKGEVDMATLNSVQTMFLAGPALYRELHVGVSRLDNTGAALAEHSLLGPDDLPPPPADATPIPPRPGFYATQTSRIVLYTASHLGYQVRIASMQRLARDAQGGRYQLQVQAAESTEQRVASHDYSVRREVQHDLRLLTAAATLVWLGIAWAFWPLRRLRTWLRERPIRDLEPIDAKDVPYEVGPLVDAVNERIRLHQQSLGEQRRFLADAAHQLRTPIAIMRTQTEYAMRQNDPRPVRDALHAIDAQLVRSQRLTDQLLNMAHASQAPDDADPVPVSDLNAVARDVVLQYVPLARAKNQDLGWDDIAGEESAHSESVGVAAAPVRARRSEVHEALANLVHNAINHTPANGSITVAVRIEGDRALAEVCDSGPGIPPEQREALFERFRRGPRKSGAAAGAGLGLAIARAYARRNGGDIILADSTQSRAGCSGLCARLSLPVVAPDRTIPQAR